MPPLMAVSIAAFIAAMTVSLIAGIIYIWPSAASPVPSETRYLLLAAFAGSLGSCIHLSTSFVNYAGNRELSRSWAWWYFLRPGVGAALAEIVYFALRAGLVTGSSDSTTAAINPYGVASIAALSGMFAKQATEKLREVFENLCSTKS